MRMLDLCAGIGGFSLAATWLGCEIAGQVEIDPWCRRVLQKHWPETPRMANVFDVKGDEFGPVDLVTAGFPCQPFSLAGKRKGGADDRAIWPEIARIVRTARPGWCLFENVAGLITIPTMGLDVVLSELEGLDYSCRAVVVPAGAVNALHRRDRVWILATDANGAGREEQRRSQPARTQQPAAEYVGGSEPVANAASVQERDADLQAAGEPRQRDTRKAPASGSARGSRRDQRHDEIARTLDIGAPRIPSDVVRRSWADGSWEHDLPRVVTAEHDRSQKLMAAGNAIVPQVAYEILRVMIGTPDGC